MTTISADEVALYDRQIRLWGMKSQEAIRNANILLITVRALGTEIAKNLILAGIGSLTIIDNDPVTEDDIGANFALSEEDKGKPRGMAALTYLQTLNPRVNIIVEPSDANTKAQDAAFFSSFDITIATDCDINMLMLLDSVVRFTQRAFYAAGSLGLYGFIFADLIQHTFVIERTKANIPTQVGPETATRQVISVTEQKAANGKDTVELVTKQEMYQPFILANTSPLPQEIRSNRRRMKQVTPLLPCLRALWEFEKAFSRLPNHTRDDLIAFTRLATEQVRELSLPVEILSNAFLRSFMMNLGAELAPACAFLGAQVAQDVINVLSKREQPIQNMLFFDGDTSSAPVYALYPLVPAQMNGMADMDPNPVFQSLPASVGNGMELGFPSNGYTHPILEDPNLAYAQPFDGNGYVQPMMDNGYLQTNGMMAFPQADASFAPLQQQVYPVAQQDLPLQVVPQNTAEIAQMNPSDGSQQPVPSQEQPEQAQLQPDPSHGQPEPVQATETADQMQQQPEEEPEVKAQTEPPAQQDTAADPAPLPAENVAKEEGQSTENESTDKPTDEPVPS